MAFRPDYDEIEYRETGSDSKPGRQTLWSKCRRLLRKSQDALFSRVGFPLAIGVAALALGILLGVAAAAPSQSRLERLQYENDSLRDTTEELRDEAAEQQSEIAERESDLRSLEAQVDQFDERETELDQRESGLDARESDLDARGAELDEREQAITETEEEIEENTIPGDGIWVVGDEIEPGTYKAQGSGSACYWARLGSLDTFDILNNHFGSAEVTVQIQSGDIAFETSGCGSWIKQ
ncbi:hypothetical protein [Glycomyces dulcitolivorans]|uniref:hypothetical protein n=1 Tax=Glycomyces dulcitolivorans TaxID=2200759 RepID=UPI000DD352AF|nr:hypothetical protein [Glycomyces dulcitolivorans]